MMPNVFRELVWPYDNYPDFWDLAMRRIARDITGVTPEIRQAFCDAWIATKMLNLRINHHPSLRRALRLLTPPYVGPEQKLYRGASGLERRRGAYGISWTSSLPTAQEFAGMYRHHPCGSVVLETTASPAAIISAIEYPPPITAAEKEEMELSSSVSIVEWRGECEYLIDRRQLGSVKVLQRYQATPH